MTAALPVGAGREAEKKEAIVVVVVVVVDCEWYKEIRWDRLKVWWIDAKRRTTMDRQNEEGEKEGKGEKLRQSIGPTSTIAIQVYR
jgi:aspartyl/asparaginyl beta-hydroxylase (cupin superfamily)